MTLWKRVIEGRLRKDITILKNEFSFKPGKLTMESIHLIRRLMELYRDTKRILHLVFTNMEKAYDKVSHEVLQECL